MNESNWITRWRKNGKDIVFLDTAHITHINVVSAETLPRLILQGDDLAADNVTTGEKFRFQIIANF